jgi:hypothetical protein
LLIFHKADAQLNSSWAVSGKSNMNEQRDAEAILAELQGQARRQAVPSITGTVYQAWCSIDSWLQLAEADQVIFLEGAEDFDIVTTQGAVAVQVRHTDASVSLGTSKAKEAVNQFWALAQREARRRVDYHYLTTSPTSRERDADFGGLSGIEAWRIASTSEDVAASVGRYLLQHLDGQSSLGQFLSSARPSALQERLFQRFHWMTDQPDMEAVKRSVDERICVLLHTKGRSVALARDVRNRLESHFWTVITRSASNERRLTFGELLQLVETATTTLLPVPIDRFADLLGALRPGAGLLRLLRDKVPTPPAPLIARRELVGRIEEMIRQRRSVLLTGTVFKGKTTVAQLVAGSLCPDAWWMNVTARTIDQVDSLLLALAGEIDGGVCPAVVVIDDLDIAPSAHRAYRDSLALVLHRARASGRAVLISAQGSAIDDGGLEGWEGFEIVPIPEITPTEVSALCIQEGCHEADAGFWGAAVYALTAGHPKLVQVRVAELSEQLWPEPTPTYIGAASAASDSVRLTSRRLLDDAWPQEVVELLYCWSECTIALHRSVVIKLAELVGGVRNPGDVLDRLTGKWIDCVEGEWFRTTPLLAGVAAAVWSPEKRAIAHARIHDAIFAKNPFSPAEAAALVYHAFIAREPYRLTMACMNLRVLEDDGAREAVERNLLWMPFVALEPGQRPAADAIAGSAFRMLQFSVGVTVDAEVLPRIAQRWIEETAIVPHPEMFVGMQENFHSQYAWMQSVGSADWT